MVLMKTALAALMGVAMVAEAASIHQVEPPTRVVRRQANRFGGGRNGGGNNNQGGQQNNNQGGQGGQNNQGNQNNQNNQGGQNNNNNNNNNNQGGNNQGNNNQASNTCLAAGALQTGSFSTGQNGGAVADGQVESRTDQANFINECNGKTLTNGLQNRGGSCNGIPMGNIPSVDNMVSTVILNPKNFQVIAPDTTFQIQVLVQNMQLGFFTNATSTYYSAPQEVNGQGNIIGHTHVTVQDTGNSLDPQQPLDPKQFAFFKGINDAGNGNGNLQATVDGGLPAGNYRVCTMAGASNHQPVLMPVAQRGSQEDCKYFTVSNDPNANGGGANNNQGGQNNQGNQGGQNNQGNQGGQNNQGNQGGQNNQGNQGGQNNQGNQGGQNNQGNQGGQNNQGNQGGQNNQGNQGGQNNQGNQGGQNNQNNQGGQGGQGGAGNQGNQGNQTQNNQGNQGNQNNQGNSGGQQGASGQGQQNNGSANAGNNGGNGQNQNAGALGGIQAPAIQEAATGDRRFTVNGATFATRAEAAQRACAIQNNACADAVNSGQAAGVTVPQCNAQEQACRAAAGA